MAAAAEAALGGEGPLAVYREDNDTPGFIHEIDVTLPDQSCTNCTLQVLQFMYDDPAAPYYFQCADLVIAEGGSEDAGGAPTSGGAGPDNTGGSSPTPGRAGQRDRATAPRRALPERVGRRRRAAARALRRVLRLLPRAVWPGQCGRARRLGRG